MNNILEIKNLSKTYIQGNNHLKILDDLSFNIEEGDNIALVGVSGCGKSTFLQIIALLDKADYGKINYFGQDYANISDRDKTTFRRNNIGFIYQFHYLMPELTALENVILPLLIQGNNMKIAQQTAQKLFAHMGILDKVDHKPSQLSGGEQQRVAIARGFIHQPKILLADEPTGNLDPNNAEKVFSLFIEEIKHRKQTSIVVTHNMDLATKFDKIITIESGKIKII